jgi:hypothetical protein
MILSSAIKTEEKSTIVGTRYRYTVSKVANREYKDYSYHCLKEIEERIVKAKDKYDKALNDYEVMKNTLFK